MATPKKGYGRYRSWSPVRDEESTTNTNLIEASTSDPQVVKKKPCITFTPFFLLILVISVMFLLGVLLGYYVRESQIYDNESILNDYNKCLVSNKNTDEKEKLESIHEDVMYFLTGDRISKFVKDFGTTDPQDGSVLEKKLETTVLKEFEKYHLDNIKIDKHKISVTYPHSTKPNTLQIYQNNQRYKKFTLKNSPVGREDNTVGDAKFPYVAFTHSGKAKGKLVFGQFGRISDFLLLQHQVELNNTILLLQIGQISIRQKIITAVEYGVKGILLYWDKDSKDSTATESSVIPFTSAGPYTEGEKLPSIPVQTISTDQADWLFNNNIVCSNLWQRKTSLNCPTSDNTVELSTFNIKKNKDITNIIATINGEKEQDRYVVVGAPRSAFPTDGNDVISNTAFIVQLARSLTRVQQLQNWKPRRSIKIVSWGGAEFSNTGLDSYVQTQKEILKRRAIAYLDINQLVLGDESIMATLSPAYQTLLSIVTTKVPDPKYPEATIHDKLMATVGDLTIGQKVPFINYNKVPIDNIFLHQLGVPSVHLQYVGQNQTYVPLSTMVTEEKQHHYKYHAAVGRVMVLVLLRLVDEELIPYSIEDYCHDLHVNLWTASEQLADCSRNKIDLSDAISTVDDVLETSKTLEKYIQTYLTVDNVYSIRSINDIKMLLDKFFLYTSNGTTSNILYPFDSNGVISHIDELCQIGKTTKDWTQSKIYQKQLENSLNGIYYSLRSSG
ncbi:hypothetical protein LOTGIDRAFT_167161 [Lottia gigantea]|uniref:Peptidase M28 domain-containing protein n=1 Tax=Lottia gigantea TaxID=225164 RepID=V3ZPU7_LOTGI|nr:hypothetical protein LOTGIDRAFT_167161 [Lottia gigantea]ESO86347.1 hypothetical protein LOTGIDRAFT_167161 [Lottia gigantea]